MTADTEASELVKRLRKGIADHFATEKLYDHNATMLEAADRITQLEQVAREARKYLEGSNPLFSSGGIRNCDLRDRIDALLEPKP